MLGLVLRLGVLERQTPSIWVRSISFREKKKISLASYDRLASWLSEWKKKMKKTDFVREVYEENHSNVLHRVWCSVFSQIFSIARSSLRYTSVMHRRDEQEKQKLESVHEEHPWYGHRRIGWSLNWSMKKTRRLMQKFGIIAQQKKLRAFIKGGDLKQEDMHGKEITVIWENGLPITSKIANYTKHLCPIAPNVVWRSDFTHIIYQWVHLYLATVIDEYSKEIVGYALSFVHTKEFILAAIQDAISKTGGRVPDIFHSDQGSEYTSYLVLQFLRTQQILVSMSSKWSPWQNGWQESYYGKLKLELWETKYYESMDHLILAVHRQISYYNTKRLHTTLRDTPRWFHEKWDTKQKMLLVNEHKEQVVFPI